MTDRQKSTVVFRHISVWQYVFQVLVRRVCTSQAHIHEAYVSESRPVIISALLTSVLASSLIGNHVGIWILES